MTTADAFLSAMERRAKLLARSAIATYETNRELCSWLLDPLARWAEAAYGEEVFDEAVLGYAKYCLGVAQAQKIYDRAGHYTPEAMPEIVSGVYDDESYMVPYMWAAILIYAFWPSMVEHLALFRDQFLRRLPPGARVLELASGHGVLDELLSLAEEVVPGALLARPSQVATAGPRAWRWAPEMAEIADAFTAVDTPGSVAEAACAGFARWASLKDSADVTLADLIRGLSL